MLPVVAPVSPLVATALAFEELWAELPHAQVDPSVNPTRAPDVCLSTGGLDQGPWDRVESVLSGMSGATVWGGPPDSSLSSRSSGLDCPSLPSGWLLSDLKILFNSSGENSVCG